MCEILTLDEAIIHAREVAEEQKSKCDKCAKEHEQLAEWLEELRQYEALKEQGKLIIPPCNVGDTVWFIRPLASKKEIIETVVEKIIIKKSGLYMKLACNSMYETSCKSLGKTVFLTYETAEAVLKENYNNV